MKKSIAILASLMAAGSVMAAPLSPAEALARLSADGPKRVAANQFIATPVFTVKCKNMNPAVYVFAQKGGEGYSIISADDNAFPLLGYSHKGVFDASDMPAAMTWWLDEYARQIEWANQQGITSAATNKAPADWVAISPLCATTWNQDAPYNNDCPVPSGSTKHTYTGCVATSMAQAMKYFNYPQQGHGTISYQPAKLGQTISMTLDGQVFDWNNMLNNYQTGAYNDTEAAAVALLMKACGFSVNMNYGLDASGAQGSSIGAAMRKYFDYDGDCHSEYRLFYSMDEWTKKVYNNLRNIGPVIINGRDLDENAGHSFICDGYDGKGYFHFNWGWGGMSDGYFSFDALNPDAMGIGGYGGGFNYNQNAIFGIQPNKGQTLSVVPNMSMFGNANPSLSGTTLNVGAADYSTGGFWNYTDDVVAGVFGLKYESVDNPTAQSVVTSATLGAFSSVNLNSMTGYTASRVRGTLPSLSNGEYKVTVMFKPNGYDEWQEIQVPWGYNNFFYLTKTNSGSTVKKVANARFSIDKAEVLSEPYDGFRLKMKLTLTNNSDMELTQSVCARLMSGSTVAQKGGNYLVTVPAGETVEQEFITAFTKTAGVSFTSPTTYTLNFVDPDTGNSYGNFGTVTMTTGPKTTTISLSKLAIKNSTREVYEFNGRNIWAYPVEDFSDFDVEFNFKVPYGYFTGLVKLSVFGTDPDDINTQIPIPALDEIFAENVFMAAKETSENVIKLSFPEAEEGVLYQLKATYVQTSTWKNLGAVTYFYKSSGSGVDDLITNDCDTPVEFYNLQGVKIAIPESGQLYIRKQGGKTEKVIF